MRPSRSLVSAPILGQGSGVRPPIVLARAGKTFPSHEGVPVAIPRRTDFLTDDSAFTRLKMLAELPHVVAAPEVAAAPRAQAVESPAQSTRTLKSSHPAFAELADLPTEEPLPRKRRQKRFVDRAHIDREWESLDERHEEDLPRKRVTRGKDREPRGHSHTRSAKQSSGWGTFFSQTHERIAPLAGLFVTAALFASAALLFWMMLTNRQGTAELNEFALPGEGFRVELSEPPLSPTDSLTTVPLAESIATPSSSMPEEFEYIPPSTSSEESPMELSTETNAATLQPTIDPTDEPALLGQLLFPVTNTPLALDYSKALHKPADDLQSLPAVAERADAATTEPINR